MRLILLASARKDLVWFRRYYGSAFPEGAVQARERLSSTLALLRAHPLAGRASKAFGTRRIHIGRTPFTIEYRVGLGKIEILHVHDSRSDQAEPDLEQET